MTGKIWSRNFVLLTLSNFLMCITYYALISTLPVYLVSELHASEVQVGVVLATYIIASVIIRPFSGFALEKFGRRTIFLISLFFYALFFAGYFIAITIASLVLLRFAQGLTWGVATISGSTIAVDITPKEKRGEGIGYFSLSTTLGMAVGPVIGLFVCHKWGYTAFFIAGLIISISGLISAYSLSLPRRLIVGRKIHFSWLTLFEKNSVRPSLNLLIIMTAYGGLLSFIALYGREIGIRNASLFFLILAGGIAISRFTAGRAFDKNGPSVILTVCLCLLILGYPVLALVKNAAGFYISAFIIGFGNGVVFPTYQAIVNNLAPENRRGAANSTLYTALDIGMGSGMILAGLIAQNFNIATVFLVNTLICIAGLIVFRIFVLDFYRKCYK
jgi:MFS family permease